MHRVVLGPNIRVVGKRRSPSPIAVGEVSTWLVPSEDDELKNRDGKSNVPTHTDVPGRPSRPERLEPANSAQRLPGASLTDTQHSREGVAVRKGV